MTLSELQMDTHTCELALLAPTDGLVYLSPLACEVSYHSKLEITNLWVF